ncbi:MAG: hypothetical protein KBS82_05960 [Oscillospiraceae bacterium]|nr:hypothetical protein [Candidatus Limimonas egerieequi]
MKAKKVLLLLLVFTLCVSFTACSKTIAEEKSALTVGDANVSAGVFAYYLDAQIKIASGESPSKSDAIKAAEASCANYVKINTEFQKRKLSLNSAEKATVAANVEEIWNFYGGYYESIGVSKETLTKIKTSEQYNEKLISSVFGAGGESEISEDAMKTYFNDNYVFFKFITAEFSSDEEANKTVKDTLTELAGTIGTEDEETGETITMDDVNASFAEKTGGTASALETTAMKSDSTDFPSGFFSDVKAMDNGAQKILTYSDNIFLVEKVDGSGSFSDYKSAILDLLTNSDYDSLMKKNYSNIKVTGIADVEDNCYNTITKVKSK